MTTNEPTIEIVEDPTLYPWTNNDNEKRRCFIFEYYPHDAAVDIKYELEAMTKIEKWLTNK